MEREKLHQLLVDIGTLDKYVDVTLKSGVMFGNYSLCGVSEDTITIGSYFPPINHILWVEEIESIKLHKLG